MLDTSPDGYDHPILIVDDHPLFRDALKMAVEAGGLDRHVLEAGSIKDARAVMKAGPLSLIILDIHLDDNEGFEGLMETRSLCPSTPVVLCSANQSKRVIKQGIELGAAGFIPKSSSQADISGAIRNVLAGEVWLPDNIDLDSIDAGDESEAQKKLASLTPAQRRVMDGVVEGRLNKQIAYEMGISEATVKAHLTSIFRKLGVTNRTQVVLLAQKTRVAEPQ